MPLRLDNATSGREQPFNNGYFRVVPAQPAGPRAFRNIAHNKPARQSSTLGDAGAAKAVDGNTDGAFGSGSVSHSLADANAWLEVDLGAVEAIDRIRIWNRTDCCGERLADSWILVSDAPFPDGEAVEMLRTRPGVWSRANFAAGTRLETSTPGLRGRYVRVQLSGATSAASSHLHLAELEVLQRNGGTAASVSIPAAGAPSFRVADFATNNANYFRINIEAEAELDVEYQMWNNPRLRFYLNGTQVTPESREGLQVIKVPNGRHQIEVRYSHRMLSLFWALYALFALALAWSFIVHAIGALRSRKRGLAC
jgi:hypothetical protein